MKTREVLIDPSSEILLHLQRFGQEKATMGMDHPKLTPSHLLRPSHFLPADAWVSLICVKPLLKSESVKNLRNDVDAFNRIVHGESMERAENAGGTSETAAEEWIY